jgi:hypothetical protein
MTKLIIAFRNFANASKNKTYVLKITRLEGKILSSQIPGLDFLNLSFFRILYVIINQIEQYTSLLVRYVSSTKVTYCRGCVQNHVHTQ